MMRREYDTLQDGDVVKLRGGTRQGPVIACVVDKGAIQFAYETSEGSITLVQLPYACLDFVSSHPEEESVPGGTRTVKTRARTRGV